MNSKKFLIRIILSLIVILVVLSGFIAIEDYFGSTVCFSDNNSCLTVQNSEYGKIFGVKVSWFGFIAFIFLLILYSFSISNNYEKKFFKRYYLIGIIFGGLFSLYLLYVQFVILQSTCSSCLIIDFGILLLGILSFIELYKSV